MLNLVSWKFAPAVKGGPYHFYCCECKSYLRVVSSMGVDLHNITWLNKYKHPNYDKSWEDKNSQFHTMRIIYPEMIYSVTKDLKTKKPPCPECAAPTLIVPAMNSQFDIQLLKKSFQVKKKETKSGECSALCSQCGEAVLGADWDDIPCLGGKFYCQRCFVMAE